MSADDQPTPCDSCGRPAARGADLFVRRRDSALRFRIGFFGRECFRKVASEVERDRQVYRVEHRGGRRVRRW